jgi:hypothetical protein
LVVVERIFLQGFALAMHFLVEHPEEGRDK